MSEARAHFEKATRDLEWAAILERIAASCSSSPGARRILALEPAETPELANTRAARARSALSLLKTGEPVPAGVVPDVEEMLARITAGSVATGPELRDLGRVLALGRALRAFAKAHGTDHPELASALATEPALDELLDEITFAIDESGSVLDRASPALGRARKKAGECRRELTGRLSELLNRYSDVLRDRYYAERDGRYVLPVRSDAPFRVDGIVLGSSASGGTLYVEPREITEIGNGLRMAEAEVEREIARVLGAMSISVRARGDGLARCLEACVEADVLLALARYGVETEGAVFSIDGSSEIDLKTARHPLLVDRPDVVANDVRVRSGSGLVISGPNAGGKTVALKCLGLAAWMARAGIPVAADPKSRIGWFEPVLTDIGDEQSLARSLSTFSAHATRIGGYLRSAGPGSLVLLDELAAGTDPDEGAALARAVIEHLVQTGAALAVTTHYERLKELAPSDARFENASVGFDFESMLPTFRLTLGVPGASSALQVAGRHGVPEDVVRRAEALLPEENARKRALLAAVEADRARAEAELRAAEAEANAQRELRRELETEVARARSTERQRLEKEGRDLLASIRQARAQLRDAQERLARGDLSREELRSIEKSVNVAAREGALGSNLDRSLRGTTKDPKASAPLDPKPGDTVFVAKLGVRAKVLEAPSRGQLKVAAGTMKLTVALDEISADNGVKAPAGKSGKPHPKVPPVRIERSPVRTLGITCDVRGLRVDEAIDRVEAFVDLLLSEGEPAGFVLHGHGTGALKSALREHLALHRFVARARAADEDQGGDAFTVFWTAE